MSCIALAVGETSVSSRAGGISILGSSRLVEDEVEHVDVVKPDEKDDVVDVTGMVVVAKGVDSACKLSSSARGTTGGGVHAEHVEDAQWKPRARCDSRGSGLVTSGANIFLMRFFVLRHRFSFGGVFWEECGFSHLLGKLDLASISFPFCAFILRLNMFRRVFSPRVVAVASHFWCIWTSSYDMTVIFG